MENNYIAISPSFVGNIYIFVSNDDSVIIGELAAVGAHDISVITEFGEVVEIKRKDLCKYY